MWAMQLGDCKHGQDGVLFHVQRLLGCLEVDEREACGALTRSIDHRLTYSRGGGERIVTLSSKREREREGEREREREMEGDWRHN